MSQRTVPGRRRRAAHHAHDLVAVGLERARPARSPISPLDPVMAMRMRGYGTGPAGRHRTDQEDPVLDDFKKFLFRGNVIDLAVAVDHRRRVHRRSSRPSSTG